MVNSKGKLMSAKTFLIDVVLSLISFGLGVEVSRQSGDAVTVNGPLNMRQVMNHGFTDATNIGSEISGGYASFNDIANVSGAINGFNHQYSFQARPQYSGAGKLDEMAAFTAELNVNGQVENGYGAQVINPVGSGVLNNFYGLFIGSLEKGRHNYSIYSVGREPGYFGGPVEILTSPNGHVYLGSVGANVPGDTYMLFQVPTGASYGQIESWKSGTGYVTTVLAPNGGQVVIGPSTGTGSKFGVIGLPVYANNAAAKAGGLTAGAFYQTGADPSVICVVQ